MALSLVGTAEDVSFYAGQAAATGGTVLILGCANGRLAFELAGKGHLVVGVDPSAEMIRSAVEELSQHSGKLQFIAADLRTFRQQERYGLVLAPHNALGLMGSRSELGALFATARHHLAPGGVFAFDVQNPAADDPPAPREHVHEGQPPLLEPARPPFVPHLRERKKDGHAPIRRLRLRLFEPAELDSALAEAGFGQVERFGGFNVKSFQMHDRQLIVVARVD